jgi:hypothetical protein
MYKRKTKTDRNKQQKAKDKKKFNYHANPFDIYKKNTNTIESDEESSIEIKKSIKKKKNADQIKNKKLRVTMNDFNKFTANNRNASDSDESSGIEEFKKKIKNKKKNALNKSVENREKNVMFEKYTNYFFDDKEIKEGILKKKKRDKEKAEKKVKKGFYHYQNNPTKVEKRVVDQKFEVRMKLNFVTTIRHPQITASDNKKEINNENTKKVKVISNLNDEIINNDDDQILNSRINKGRNNNTNSIDKRQNNTIAYSHKMTRSQTENQNKSKGKVTFNQNNTGLKKNDKKINLMNEFDQSMNDYSKFNTINNMNSRDTKKINSKSNLRGSYNKKKSKNDLETDRNGKNQKKMIHFKTGFVGNNKNKTNGRTKSKKNLKTNKH